MYKRCPTCHGSGKLVAALKKPLKVQVTDTHYLEALGTGPFCKWKLKKGIIKFEPYAEPNITKPFSCGTCLGDGVIKGEE